MNNGMSSSLYIFYHLYGFVLVFVAGQDYSCSPSGSCSSKSDRFQGQWMNRCMYGGVKNRLLTVTVLMIETYVCISLCMYVCMYVWVCLFYLHVLPTACILMLFFVLVWMEIVWEVIGMYVVTGTSGDKGRFGMLICYAMLCYAMLCGTECM